MDECKWLACTDPNPMLEYLWAKPGDRKLRLFAAACCRQVWERITHPLSRAAVEVSERYADGQATADEVARARQQHWDCGAYRTQRNAANAVSAAALVTSSSGLASLEAALEAAKYAAKAATDKVEGGDRSYKDPAWLPLWKAARESQVNLLRDIISNPFRPLPSITPSILQWNGNTVKRLAKAVYEERVMPAGTLDHQRLAVLADALEEAGCADQDFLGHLRQPGAVHVRGCFALDLILDRK